MGGTALDKKSGGGTIGGVWCKQINPIKVKQDHMWIRILYQTQETERDTTWEKDSIKQFGHMIHIKNHKYETQ